MQVMTVDGEAIVKFPDFAPATAGIKRLSLQTAIEDNRIRLR